MVDRFYPDGTGRSTSGSAELGSAPHSSLAVSSASPVTALTESTTSSSPAASLFSNSHEELTQRPFSATATGRGIKTTTGAIRMRDREILAGSELQLNAPVPPRWDGIEDVLQSLGIVESNKADERLWWGTSAAQSVNKNRYGSIVEPLDRDTGHTLARARPNSYRAAGGMYEVPPTLADRLQKGSMQGNADGSVHVLKSGKFQHSSTTSYGYPEYIDGGAVPPPIFDSPDSSDETLTLLLPLLVLLSTLIFLLLIFVVLVIFVRRRARIALTDGDGPLDVGREEELEGMGGLDGVEERWLEQADDATRRGYLRSKDWALSFPPGSQSSEITLSQFLSIQEKGVSAWSFDPDYESNPGVFVAARTEIAFMADGEGMAPQEGGGCSVQSNLPLPKLNDVYYWEAKLFSKPDATNIAIGLATKPFPSFRMPGWNKFSVGYFSVDGFKCHNYPFAAQSYGPAYMQGDVIGVGYRPRSGTVFFTRNGKKLEDAFVGLNRYNLFPTIGADGAAEVHVNLGQSGFVFIEANVKKWGLAPMVGTLAPPPPYGMERGSILIETGQGTSGADQSEQHLHESEGETPTHTHLQPPPRRSTPPPPLTPPNEHAEMSGQLATSSSSSSSLSQRVRARRSRQSPELPYVGSRLPAGIQSSVPFQAESRFNSPRRDSMSSTEEPNNPPTPNHLDISLHSLDGAGQAGSGTSSMRSNGSSATVRAQLSSLNAVQYVSAMLGGGHGRGSGSSGGTVSGTAPSRTRSPSPPPYTESRTPGSGGWSPNSSTGASQIHNQVRRSSGHTHSMANTLFGALTERGLLTSLSAVPDGARRPTALLNEPAPLYSTSGGAGGQAAPRSEQDHRQGNWLASWFH